MKLIYIGVYSCSLHDGANANANANASLLGSASNLDSFGYFTRSTVAKHLSAGTQLIAESVARTPLQSRLVVELSNAVDLLCHVLVRPVKSSQASFKTSAEDSSKDSAKDSATRLECLASSSLPQHSPVRVGVESKRTTESSLATTCVVCIVTDREYPAQTALLLAKRATEQGSESSSASAISHPRVHFDTLLSHLLQQAQNPAQVDKLWSIQHTLDATMEIMYRNMHQLMERGESLDALMLKSDALRDHADAFRRQAARQNQCCRAF